MRQLCHASDWLLQNTPMCLYNSEQKAEENLERAEIRHNFASEIRKTNINNKKITAMTTRKNLVKQVFMSILTARHLGRTQPQGLRS